MICPNDKVQMDVALKLDKKRWKDMDNTAFLIYVCPKCYITASFGQADPEDVRRCDYCQKPMKEGYTINGGEHHYCSKKCLNTEISDKEFNELYDDGNGDSYWTEYASYLESLS